MIHSNFEVKVKIFLRFDANFDPEKHNAWLRRHLMAKEKREKSREEELRQLEELRRRRRYIKFVPFTWCRCVVESVIIGDRSRNS